MSFPSHILKRLEASETYGYPMFFCFPDSIYVDESLVNLIFALSHLCSKKVELFKLQLIKLIVR